MPDHDHRRAVAPIKWMICWLGSSQNSLTLMRDQFPDGFFLQKTRSSFGENANDTLIWFPMFCHFCSSFPLQYIGFTAAGFFWCGARHHWDRRLNHTVLSSTCGSLIHFNSPAPWQYVTSLGYTYHYSFSLAICVCGYRSLFSIKKKFIFFNSYLAMFFNYISSL